jgi:hypothetical protein
MGERFWLEETDPDELVRRAADLRKDGLLAMAEEFLIRADHLRQIKSLTRKRAMAPPADLVDRVEEARK